MKYHHIKLLKGYSHYTCMDLKVDYVSTGPKMNWTRILKPQAILERMDPDDTKVYATNILGKYKNRPDELESMCFVDFFGNYVSEKGDIKYDAVDLQSYTAEVQDLEEIL